MALSAQQIDALDKATGLPAGNSSSTQSRSDEIMGWAKSAQTKAPTQPTPQPKDESLYGGGDQGIAHKLADDVSAGAKDIQRGDVMKGIVKSGARVAGDVTGTIFHPVGEVIDKVTGGGFTKLNNAAAESVDKKQGLFGELADKITDIPAVQKFAMEHPNAGEDFSRALNLLMAKGETGKIDPATALERTKGQIKTATDTAMKPVESLNKTAGKLMENKLAKDQSKASVKADRTTGTIVQGAKEDIVRAKKTLTSMDTSKIKTYSDLKTVLDDRIKATSQALDKNLDTKTETKPLSDLVVKAKVGEETVSHNYVKDALEQLQGHYKAINDPVGEAKIAQLQAKAEEGGLTVKEVNDIAKIHGSELNAFNANGQAASGLTKQAAENTRTGVKATAREMYGDESFKAVDSSLSDMLRTRDLVGKVEEKVNQLKQRVTDRGLGEKVGRLVFQVADKITGGGLKGFVQSFVPRGEGLKIMNALDLEKGLQKNLKTLQKLIEQNPSEAEMEAGLKDILGGQSSDAFLKSQPTNAAERSNLNTNGISKNDTTSKQNMQGGFIKNPLAGKAPKIHPEDLGDLRDFTDYVAGTYKPKTTQIVTDARRIAVKYGLVTAEKAKNIGDKALSSIITKSGIFK